MDPLSCARHPATETYLRCAECDTPICPACWVDAAIGYHCPDCAARREAHAGPAAAGRGRPASGTAPGGFRAPSVRRSEGRLPVLLALRAMGAGVLAASVGGLVLGPVLSQGLFFLLTAGLLGWASAHAVFFGTGGVTSPFVRAAALTAGALTVAVGMATISLWDPVGGGRGEVAFLAYPAAVYGAWVTVRNRLG